MRFYPVFLLTVLLLNVSVIVADTHLIGYWASGQTYQRASLDKKRTYTKHYESATSSTRTETDMRGWSEEIRNAHSVEVSAAGTIAGMDLGAQYGYSRDETTTNTHERIVEDSASKAFTYSETVTTEIDIPAADSVQYPMTNVFFWRTRAITQTLACCEDAHEMHIDYHGGDIHDGKKYGVPDACSCQKLCAERDDCKYWTYAPFGDDYRTCWLKGNKNGREYDHDRVSGSKHCANQYEYTYAESEDSSTEWPQNGCGYDIAPNCLPTKCHEDDPMCWTCTSPEFKIDPSFTPPERCTRCQSREPIFGSQDWFTCKFKTGVYKCGGYCCCKEGYEPDDNGVCNRCESSTTEDESELASVNMKLKRTNKALIEALEHLAESEV